MSNEDRKRLAGLTAILRNAEAKREPASVSATSPRKNYDAPVITEDMMKDQLEAIVRELPRKLERINAELKKNRSSGRSYTMRTPEPRNEKGQPSSSKKHETGQLDYGAPYYFVIIGSGWNYVPFADKPKTGVKGFILKRSRQPGAQQLELWESAEMYSDLPEVRTWKNPPHLVEPYLNAVCDTLVASFHENEADPKKENE